MTKLHIIIKDSAECPSRPANQLPALALIT